MSKETQATVWPKIALAICVLVVAAISIHDAALIVLNDEVIRDTEQNPMGRWLIRIGDGDIFPFVVVKLLGTLLVCTTLLTMYTVWPKKALTVAAAITCFQLCLLFYLSTG